MIDFVFIGLTAFLAAAVQGLSGFGSGLMGMSLLSLFLPIKTVAPLVALWSFVICGVIFLQLREHFSLRRLLPLVFGALLGVPVGVYFLRNFDEKIIKTILGICLLVYVIYALQGREIRHSLNQRWGYLFGFVSGTMGGAFNIAGPPVVIYTAIQSWNKNEIKVTLQSYFILCCGFTIIAHAVSGLTTLRVVKYFAGCLPVIFIGIWIGSVFYNRIDQIFFRRIIFFSLLIFAVLLLIKP